MGTLGPGLGGYMGQSPNFSHRARMVRLSEWEVSKPRPWHQPISKVYDVNRISGEFYYKPMIEYINHKEDTGLEIDTNNLIGRKRVHLPSALEATTVDISCLSSGKPNFVSFLAQYGARQIKEKNTMKAHIKHAFARGCKSSETIKDKRNSVIIRDQYINCVDTMHREQLRRIKYIQEEEERKSRMANLDHENLKHLFYQHPRESY